MALYAGQGAALVKERQPVARIIETMVAEAAATLTELSAT